MKILYDILFIIKKNYFEIYLYLTIYLNLQLCIVQHKQQESDV